MTAAHFTQPFTITFSRRLSCPNIQCSVTLVSAATLIGSSIGGEWSGPRTCRLNPGYLLNRKLDASQRLPIAVQKKNLSASAENRTPIPRWPST